MIKTCICLLLISFNISSFSQTIDHSLWSDFLQKYVSEDGRVNYQAVIENDKKDLNIYLNEFIRVSPKNSWSKNEKLAYWINAYNAFTIKLIVDHYPLKSIRDINNPWDINFIPINNNLLSLNYIEHKILRNMNEPRIHFAIVCASVSCPKLIREAYLPKTLEEQLSKATKDFLKSDKNQISENQVNVSRIFKWFTSDFKINGSIIPFINAYTDITISPNADISYLEYNWSLNQ